MNRQAFGRLFALLLVTLLHAALLALFLFGVIRPSRQVVLEKPVEISLDEKRNPLRLPPPLVKLDAPRSLDVAPPHFDVVPESQVSVVAGAQDGQSKTAGGGTGGQGARKAPPPPPPDPHCDTTIEAYDQLVHNAIERYLRYSQDAQLRRIEGTITLHFISDDKGQVLAHAVADSRVTRSFSGKTPVGGRVAVLFSFQRIRAAQWNYRATVNASSGAVLVGQGTLDADADGMLRAADGQAGSLAFQIPAGVLGDSSSDVSVEIGRAEDLFMLEDSAQQALVAAEPLPKIPLCLNLRALNALMPFNFQMNAGHVSQALPFNR